jgi:hypothetical protein
LGTTLKTTEAERILAKLQMVVKRDGYHVRGFFFVDGTLVAVAQYSHGKKDLPGRIPIRFRKSLYLTEQEFFPMRKCTMSLEDYLVVLRTKGKIT